MTRARQIPLPSRLVPLLVLLWPVAANGDPSSLERDKEEGKIAFRLGHYTRAIDAFERAYKTSQDHRLLFNLAMCYRKRFDLRSRRDDLIRARNQFRLFRALVRSEPGRPDNDKIVKALTVARIKERECNQLLAKSRPPASGPPASEPTTATSKPAASAAVAPLKLRRDSGHRDDKRSSAAAAWIAYSAAGALAVGAVITGVLAVNADADARSAYERGDRTANRDAASRTRDLAITTDVLAIASGAAVVTAVLLHWRPWQKTRVTLGPGRVGIAGSF